MQTATQATLDFLKLYWAPLLCGIVIVAVLPLIAGYIVLIERKLMADMQARLGPMRVGPHGLLQPIADAVKLLIKEDIIPENADKMLFWAAPLISVTAALLALAECRLVLSSRLPTSTSACFLFWASARWGFSELFLVAGPRIAITRCWARCAARRSWSAMKPPRGWR